MKCKNIHKLVFLAQSGELSGDDKSLLAEHLEQCASCMEYAEDFKRVMNRAEGSLRTGDVPEHIIFGIRQMAVARAHEGSKPGFPGKTLQKLFPGSVRGFFSLARRYSVAAAAALAVLVGIWAFVSGSRDNGTGDAAFTRDSGYEEPLYYELAGIPGVDDSEFFSELVFSTAGDDLFGAMQYNENLPGITQIDREILLLDALAI